jgi:transposase
MKAQDARSLPEASLELLRRQAHRLRQEGHTWEAVASIVGVSRWTLMSWARRFGVGSDRELSEVASARRGRRFGEGRTLSFGDEVELREQIIGALPTALGLPHALWSRRAVQEAVKIRFALDMPIRTVGEYLNRWGFTPQRPAKQAVEQRPEEVQRWLQVDYPAIVEKAKAEGAEIYWGDETAVRQDAAWLRGYAPAGQTPVLPHSPRRHGISMLSALTNQGLVRFALYDGAVNSERFIEFLQALVADSAGRKVHLIVDNLRVHRARRVQAWLDGKAHLIELHFLPPYSPEANPDELLNRDLKTELRSRPAAKHAHALKTMALAFMHKLISLPERVRRYFQSHSTAYASASASVGI